MTVAVSTIALATLVPSGAAVPERVGVVLMPAPDATSARSETCRSARVGLAWYRGRYNDHRELRGANTKWPAGRKSLGCPDARQLAKVWRGKALTARRVTERWQRDIGRIVRLLERGLRGTPMEGTGILLERYGRRYGVSPFFMVATAATESSIGHVACSNNRRNVWGLASCVNSWPVPYFETWDEAIAFYARFLATRWPGHSTPFSFRGYAACSDCWGRKVSYWMRSLYGVPAVTRYP